MASLKSFVVEGNLAQKGLSTNGAGETSYGAKGTLNANLPEGLKAKVKISDKTLSSVRARASACGRIARRARAGGAEIFAYNSAHASPPLPRAQLANNLSIQPEDASIEVTKDGAAPAARAARGRARGWLAEACKPWANVRSRALTRLATRCRRAAAQTPSSSATTCTTSRRA